MTLPARRKPLALFLCCGFASVLVGAYATEAQAQAPAPLRVDPVLLGLPPVKPVEAPAPVARPVAVEKPVVEVKPIEQPTIEPTSIEPEPEPNTPPAKAVKQPAPEASVRSAVPKTAPMAELPVTPAIAVPAAPSRPPPKPLDPQPAPVVPPPAAAIRPVVQPPPTTQVVPMPVRSTLDSASGAATLRVDPALLGMPPMAATAASPSTPVVAGSTRQAPVTIAASTRAPGGLLPPVTAKPSAADKSWFSRVWDPISNAYNNGDWEIYLPLHTHHLRSKYTAEKIATYQENPPGFGFGRGSYDEKGNWDGVYAMGFQDSHFKPMYIAGYGWKAIWRPAEDWRLGLGYTAGLMSRADMLGYVPFPIVLPMASLAYKNLSLETTFVPGAAGAGNIFFIWAKWELGKNGEAIGTPARPGPDTSIQLASGASSGASLSFDRQRVPYGPALALESGAGARVTASADSLSIPGSVAVNGEAVPDVTPSLALRSSKRMETVPKDSTVPRPVFLSADRMGGEMEREFNAEGDSELRKIGTVLTSDRLTYWPIEDEVEAEGNVRLEQGEDVITGPKMRLKLEDQIGFFEQPSYTLKRQPSPGTQGALNKAYAAQFAEQQEGNSWLTSGFATPRVLDIKPGQTTFKESTKSGRTMTEARGEADRIDFEGENQVRLTNATYTTCSPGNNDWYARSSDLKLDYDREVGEGKDGTVYFKDVPIFYSPWLSFSLNNERKSGVLAPTFGTSSDSGIEFSLPYYWNIAPNMDATIRPRVLSKRGVQVSNEFRYLDTAYGGLYNGQARAEILPSDSLRSGDNRYGFSLLHNQTMSNGFAGLINYNKVSDDNYYTDLSSGIASTSTTQLLQQAQLTYSGGGWWSATANIQQYQTLQPDPKNPVLEPYKLLPQITVNARKPDFYSTDSSFFGQYSNFTRNDQFINGAQVNGANGQRTVLYPQIALPYVTPGWYITPKLGMNIRHYSLSGQAAGTPGSISTTLPIVSVDSGMTFERTSNWFGRDYTQTLEPRLYYLNVPYKDQSSIPLFDTGLADFNFAQIFSENQFSSWDRVSNANQLTAAATSRLLEPNTGNEILRAMIGQRFYFERNKVNLSSTISTTASSQKWDKSDFLAAFSGQVLPKVYADAAWQYNLSDRQIKRFSLGTRYQPEPGKVLNAAYRYNRDVSAPIDQVDLSGQWPITGRWHAVGRLNYSFKDDGTNLSTSAQGGRMIESIAGLEYNGGCWVARGVVRRQALTQDNSTTAFFIQLELNDFARIGSNPLNILKRNVQGYGLINQSVADPVFGE